MGKSSTTTSGPPAGDSASDAVSLRTQPGDRYLDDDTPDLPAGDELPPLYSDLDDSSDARLLPGSEPADILYRTFEDETTGYRYYIHKTLDTSPEVLARHVRYWAQQPPRPYVQVKGKHREPVVKQGKKEHEWVTDFDVQIELTPYLYSNATHRISWQALRTVENSELAKRGSVFKCRAPEAAQSIEVGRQRPSLEEWCHRYCASHAGIKAFSLRRAMVGFDEEKIRKRIENLVRGTNYRGHVEVTYPVKEDLVEVYNDCRINTWRMTRWIQILCMFTLMFIFTVPYLFLRTKRFEVVRSEWHFSRLRPDGGKEYVSLSEDNWFNLWGRALSRAVLSKRQCTLDQEDLVASEGAEPTFADTGNQAVDSALSLVRAGVNAMNEVNRNLGWGGDC